MVPISVLILAKNEERNIEACIKSCLFAEEIIVIDDFSTDKTVEIAERLGAKVIQRAMNGDWGGQQTFAIRAATHDWIFFIDADERCTPALAREIEEKVILNEPYSYYIKRRNKFHHNVATHGSLRPDYVCRLMPAKDSYVDGYVHPTIVTPYARKNLSAFMYHYTYDNWEQQINKINNYTTLAAKKYLQEGKSANFVGDILLRPVLGFIKMYIIHGGFLDGKIGFVLAINHYFYVFMKYVKLYYLEKSNGKL